MINPLISIIMPLYNAECFLEETLTSILNQTFKNYELICINDCSNDDTVNIVSRFQKSDSRIKILENRKRMGAAPSRNYGIEEARGKYIIFLDGDDIFDEDLLQSSYITAEEYKADIVMFEYRHVVSEHIYEKQTVTHSAEYIDRFCKRTMSVDDLRIADFLSWSSGACNKLFRREFIQDNHLEFQNLPSNNDTYFIDMTFFLSKRIIVLNSYKIMLYARDHTAPDRISMDRNPMCIYYAMSKVKNELEQRGVLKRVYKLFNYRAFQCMLIGLKCAKTEAVRKDFWDFLLKEGFDTLLGKLETEFGMDQFLLNKKENLLKCKLKEGWDEIFSVYEIYLEECLEEIRAIFRKCKINNKKIGVWGVGKYGKLFLGFCNKYSLDIDMVIDMDERKTENFCEGYRIQLPKDGLDLDVIIFTPHQYSNISFGKILEENNIMAEIIFLNVLICSA